MRESSLAGRSVDGQDGHIPALFAIEAPAILFLHTARSEEHSKMTWQTCLVGLLPLRHLTLVEQVAEMAVLSLPFFLYHLLLLLNYPLPSGKLFVSRSFILVYILSRFILPLRQNCLFPVNHCFNLQLLHVPELADAMD